jgi:hypothetical protein
LSAHLWHTPSNGRIDVAKGLKTSARRSRWQASFTPWARRPSIRAGGDQHPAHSFYEMLDRINDYTANYHHEEDPRGAAELFLDQTELMGYVNTTLKIVNALPA